MNRKDVVIRLPGETGFVSLEKVDLKKLPEGVLPTHLDQIVAKPVLTPLTEDDPRWGKTPVRREAAIVYEQGNKVRFDMTDRFSDDPQGWIGASYRVKDGKLTQ